MKLKTILVLGLVVVLGVVVATRMHKQPVTRPSVERAPALAEVVPVTVTPAVNPDPVPAEPAGNVSANAPVATNSPQKIAVQSNQTSPPKEQLADPLARGALSLVGVDPDAEQYWMGAIFDSSLPDQEREDLMEDLNEEGLSDPRHPTPDDLVLIRNRMVILDDVLQYAAADSFMLEHLMEPYKDLWNLLNGQPPQ